MNTIDSQMMMRPNILAMNESIHSKVQHVPQRISTNRERRNSDCSSGSEDMNNMFTKFAFPFKLHSILENAGTAGQEAIISWLPSGKAFKIHKPKEFADAIMPQYFNQTKYRSFQRQLYIYGFDRIKVKGADDFGAYFHEFFIRGVSDLCLKMERKKVKGTGLSNEERQKKASCVRSKSKLSSQNKCPSKSRADITQYQSHSTTTNQMSMSFAKDNSPTNTQSMHTFFDLSSSQSEQLQQKQTTTQESSLESWNDANTAAIINSALQVQGFASRQRGLNNNNNVAGLGLPQCNKIFETGRRCSLGFVRGVRMGRRGSLLYDGDEICFGDRKFYFTTEYK